MAKRFLWGEGGVFENSPALQLGASRTQVRQSRQGRQRLLSSLPGLLPWGGVGPSPEGLGYCQGRACQEGLWVTAGVEGPGTTACYKVYVVLKTDNERESGVVRVEHVSPPG